MSVEDNKAIIHVYVETVWNDQQLDRAEEVVAPDFLSPSARGPGSQHSVAQLWPPGREDSPGS